MIKVVDRVPTYPGRVKITKENGTIEYVTWERADEPTVEGTPINKALFDSISADVGLSENTTVYVSTSGSDTLGDGSLANPYATINKALSVIPKNLNGFSATVDIAAGVYAEDVSLVGFSGGRVILTGVDGSSVSINSMLVESAFCEVTRINLFLTTTSTIAILVRIGGIFYGISNLFISGGYNIGVVVNAAMFYLDGTLSVNNTLMNGVSCSNSGTAYIKSLEGESSTGVALSCGNGGTICYGTSTTTYPANTFTNSGGRIYTGAQTSVPNY